jgi:TctA family transporter
MVFVLAQIGIALALMVVGSRVFVANVELIAHGLHIPPLVLALVLGDRAEDSFRQSMLLSQGSLGIFFSKPLVATLTIAALAILIVPSLAALRRPRTVSA